MAEENKKTTTRREFLKKSGYVTGGVVGGGVLGGLLGSQIWKSEPASTVAPVTEQQHDQALQYFTNRDVFEILSQATERIFPEDDIGPGAIGLGVPYFIDHQLAGQWGINAKMYMQGPFFEGVPEQGYQTQLKRHQIFDLGLEAIEKYSQSKFNERFVSLEGEQQDEVIAALENDEIEIPGLKSSFFFNELRTATLEGAYADPLYGGNKDKQGWKMIEYPGVQMTYAQNVEDEEFLELEPKSLHDTHHSK